MRVCLCTHTASTMMFGSQAHASQPGCPYLYHSLPDFGMRACTAASHTSKHVARSPMTRVVKVLWAAGKSSRRRALRQRRQREREARARSGFSGCVLSKPQNSKSKFLAAEMLAAGLAPTL